MLLLPPVIGLILAVGTDVASAMPSRLPPTAEARPLRLRLRNAGAFGLLPLSTSGLAPVAIVFAIVAFR